MRDQQRARPGRAQDRGDLLAQPLAQAGVERGERLVEQHDLGVGGQRAGQRDPLALAARELVRVAVGAAGEPDELEALGHALAGRVAPKPTLPATVRCGNSAPCWKTMPMRRASGSTQAPAPGDRPPGDPHGARVGALEAGDHPQQRRLARAARAEHREEAAALEPQVDAVDRAPSTAHQRALDRRLAAFGRRVGDGSSSAAILTAAVGIRVP